jgi:hypothetical protein
MTSICAPERFGSHDLGLHAILTEPFDGTTVNVPAYSDSDTATVNGDSDGDPIVKLNGPGGDAIIELLVGLCSGAATRVSGNERLGE